MALAVGGFALTLGTIFFHGIVGLYCLVGVSACMSLMFPTIYGIALKGLGEDAKIRVAGLIMAILGGSVMPPMQGKIIDLETVNVGVMTLPAVHASFRPAADLFCGHCVLRVPNTQIPPGLIAEAGGGRTRSCLDEI